MRSIDSILEDEMTRNLVRVFIETYRKEGTRWRTLHDASRMGNMTDYRAKKLLPGLVEDTVLNHEDIQFGGRTFHCYKFNERSELAKDLFKWYDESTRPQPI